MSGNSSGDDKQTLVRKNDAEGFGPRRMWFWLSTVWKKISISIHTFLRDNFVLGSFSIALALYYVIPKLDSRGSKLASYSDLIKGIRNGTVKELQFEENSQRIFYNTKSTYSVDSKYSSPSFYYRDKKGNPRTIQEYQDRHQWQYYTIGFESSHCEIRDKISKSGYESNIRYSVAPQSVLMVMRTALISSLHNCGPFNDIMDKFIHRWIGFTKSNPKLTANSCGMVKFEDVQGVDAAKMELLEIVACLRGDSTYRKLGAKLPRGVLLMGPPGTGKTLIARAMAGEARVPFFSISASEFVELYVGVGAGRIRDLFAVARKCAPSIIFIDEIDCIGGQRHQLSNNERDQTLNQLLTEMDGFDEKNRKVVVIGATNRAEILDPALRRPGRFTRKILVGKPNEDGRRKILAVHLRGIPLEEDTQLVCDLVASLTQGLVGADLANIANEATLLAARRGGECVSREDIMGAVERVQFDAINGQSHPESNEVGHQLHRKT